MGSEMCIRDRRRLLLAVLALAREREQRRDHRVVGGLSAQGPRSARSRLRPLKRKQLYGAAQTQHVVVERWRAPWQVVARWRARAVPCARGCLTPWRSRRNGPGSSRWLLPSGFSRAQATICLEGSIRAFSLRVFHVCFSRRKPARARWLARRRKTAAPSTIKRRRSSVQQLLHRFSRL